jgi:hypothetical protein
VAKRVCSNRRTIFPKVGSAGRKRGGQTKISADGFNAVAVIHTSGKATKASTTTTRASSNRFCKSERLVTAPPLA